MEQGWVKKHPPVTQETKEKISKKNKGKTSWNKGVQYSPNTLEKYHTSLIEHFGTLKNYCSHQQELSKQTKLSKYGDENYNNRNKAKQTIDNIPDFYDKRNKKKQKIQY